MALLQFNDLKCTELGCVRTCRIYVLLCRYSSYINPKTKITKESFFHLEQQSSTRAVLCPHGDFFLLSRIREGTTGESMRQGRRDTYQQNKPTSSTKVWRNPKQRQMKKIMRLLPMSWETAGDLSDRTTCTLRHEEKQSKLQLGARHRI